MSDFDSADEARSARRWLAKVERRHVVAGAVAITLAALLGIYREAVFLSHFRINYLEYLGVADIGYGVVNLLATVFDGRFLGAFVVLVGALMVILVIAYALWLCVAALRHATSMGRPFLPISDAIRETLAKRLPDRHSLPAHLRRYIMRPYRLGFVVSVAALLAINVSTSAERDDVRRFAEALRAAPPDTDFAALRRAMPSDYRVVSVQTQEPPARLYNLVDLGSSQGFYFYYDAVAQRPVVLPKSTVATVLPDDAIDGSDAVEVAARDGADGSVDGVRALGIDGTSRDGGRQETSESVTAQAAQVDPSASAQDDAPASTGATPAGQGETSGADGVVATDDSATGDVRGGDATADRAPAAGSGGGDAARAARDDDDLAEIQSNFAKSRDGLDSLKQHMSALEGQVSEVNNFVGELDATLGKLDQLFAELAEEAAVAGGLREHLSGVSSDIELASYAECREVDLPQPIQFDADQTGLDFEAIGLLFQARAQLTANQRAAERGEWLVIEGHDDTAGSTAENLALSRQRAEGVRDFLRAELGVPEEILKVAALGGTGPEARFVRIYDCLDRPQRTASAPPARNLGLTRTAAAAEVGEAPSAGGGAVEIDTEAADDELQIALADLDARENERGLVLTVPGDLLWETNSDRVRPPAEPRLAQVASLLERYAPREVVITGHSDAYGARDYNRQLSERRAQAVRDHLTERHGIDGDRLLTRGMGEDQPIASNQTPDGRQANRRIEIQLVE